MREFCADDFFVYLVTPAGYETRTLAQLLPDSFSL
jgi:cytidine deaminase